MKFFKTLNLYKASNVRFNPLNMSATSYDWWGFVGLVDGLLVFNNYFYSPSTSKHQRKVRRLLSDLNIKIDLEMPIPSGLQTGKSLGEYVLESEAYLCNKFLDDEIKKQTKSDSAKLKRRSIKLEDYLENSIHFRDYEIKSAEIFGQYNVQGVHKIIDLESIENDVSDAIETFSRDGFGRIIFYIDIAA